MNVRRLVVVYDGPREPTLEDALKEMLSKHNWDFYTSGMDLIENEFDLSFFREDDDDI